MNAEILCVGTEILLGDIVNTNAAYLAKELAECGISCYHQSVVGDNPQRLKEILRQAFERSDIVITTGGLGPTYDDLTKETIAEYFGKKMVLHEDILKHLVEVFKRFGRPMTKNNEKQAYMPEDAIIFPNDRGTAPGLAIEENEKIAIMMPGPPSEMTPMFESYVKPYLLELSHTTLRSRNVHLFGIGESAVEDILREEMKSFTNPTIAPYAKQGEVLLRITASGKNKEDADKLIEPVIEQICDRFEEYVYGVDVGTLQNALVEILKEKHLTIATAESCTGGYISKRITEISGASEIFHCGVCTYSDETKTKLIGVQEEALNVYGAVSEQTALAMAQGVRNLAGSDIGISVTGIAGPEGGSEEKPVGLVYVGISCDKTEQTLKLNLSRNYSGERELIRYSASSHALNLALKIVKKYYSDEL